MSTRGIGDSARAARIEQGMHIFGAGQADKLREQLRRGKETQLAKATAMFESSQRQTNQNEHAGDQSSAFHNEASAASIAPFTSSVASASTEAVASSDVRSVRNVASSSVVEQCRFCDRRGLACARNSELCVQNQKDTECHACGVAGCWTTNPFCELRRKGHHDRPLVLDARTDGHAAPNMFRRRAVRICTSQIGRASCRERV